MGILKDRGFPDDSRIRLLAETFLITAKTYTENAETILNHIKNPAEILPKCQNPHLPKLPKPCQNYSKHIVRGFFFSKRDFELFNIMSFFWETGKRVFFGKQRKGTFGVFKLWILNIVSFEGIGKFGMEEMIGKLNIGKGSLNGLANLWDLEFWKTVQFLGIWKFG
ncbi:unnamed protein product [Rhizophagus irregularis]|nr:unnamed protein product [Rhizophagus irregularis]